MGDATPVFAFRLLGAPPGRLVFHEIGAAEVETGECSLDPTNKRWVTRRACGRVAHVGRCHDHEVEYPCSWDHGDYEFATWLRRDQADLLGRRCVNCERAIAAEERRG